MAACHVLLTLLGPGEFLPRVQAGGYAEGIDGEVLPETGEQLLQGEGATQLGVARLRLQRSFGQELVDRMNSFNRVR